MTFHYSSNCKITLIFSYANIEPRRSKRVASNSRIGLQNQPDIVTESPLTNI